MIQVRFANDVAIVTFDPRPSSPRLTSGTEFHDMIGRGTRDVLIDLSNLDLLTSARLGDIILIDQTLRNVSGKLKLCIPDATMREVLAVTKLDNRWPTYGSVEEGILAFATD